MRREQFIQFQMNGHAILVLALLNEKDHQERDDGRARVDDQLPAIGEMK